MKKNKILATLVLSAIMIVSTQVNVFATPQLEGLTNEQKIQVLDNEIITSIDKVDNLKKDIENKEKELKDKYDNLVETNTEYRKQKKSIDIKSKNINKNDNLKILDLILSSDNLGDFFQTLDLSKKIIKENNKTIKQLDEKENLLLKQQEELKKELDKLNEDKETLEESQKELESKKKEIEEEISRLAISRSSAIGNLNQTLPILDKPASDKATSVLNEAYKYIGVPYVWGGTTPSGFDCSGFTSYVYRNSVGVSLPRVSQSQQNFGARVSISDIEPGDLVFFGSPAYHVGIYLGNGQYIHAPNTGDVVRIATLNPSTVSSVSRVI